MRRVLYILAMLDDEDVDWMVSVGKKQEVSPGEVIITEGVPLEAIYVVLAGRFAVVVGKDRTDLERLSAGEMFGEISMLDSRPPTATVLASEPSTVLRIQRSAVNARLATNTGFAARFYKALAVFLATRLRKTVATFGYGEARVGESNREEEDELDPEILDSVSLAGARFNMILDRLRRV